MVLDTVGGGNLEKCFEASRVLGTVVTIAGGGSHDLSLMQAKSLTLHVESMLVPLFRGVGREAQGRILRETAKLVDDGKLKPLVDLRTRGRGPPASGIRKAGRKSRPDPTLGSFAPRTMNPKGANGTAASLERALLTAAGGDNGNAGGLT